MKVAFCGGQALTEQERTGRRGLAESIQEIVLSWLSGMAIANRDEDQLRKTVRDTILESDPQLRDDFAVEALATPGSDLDAKAESWLRGVAENRPNRLNPAIESFVVAMSMSQSHPQLLLDLAEAYYIERPNLERRWGGISSLDDGIRDFQHGLNYGLGYRRQRGTTVPSFDY